MKQKTGAWCAHNCVLIIFFWHEVPPQKSMKQKNDVGRSAKSTPLFKVLHYLNAKRRRSNSCNHAQRCATDAEPSVNSTERHMIKRRRRRRRRRCRRRRRRRRQRRRRRRDVDVDVDAKGPQAERRTPNAERRTSNAERR